MLSTSGRIRLALLPFSFILCCMFRIVLLEPDEASKAPQHVPFNFTFLLHIPSLQEALQQQKCVEPPLPFFWAGLEFKYIWFNAEMWCQYAAPTHNNNTNDHLWLLWLAVKVSEYLIFAPMYTIDVLVLEYFHYQLVYIRLHVRRNIVLLHYIFALGKILHSVNSAKIFISPTNLCLSFFIL